MAHLSTETLPRGHIQIPPLVGGNNTHRHILHLLNKLSVAGAGEMLVACNGHDNLQYDCRLEWHLGVCLPAPYIIFLFPLIATTASIQDTSYMYECHSWLKEVQCSASRMSASMGLQRAHNRRVWRVSTCDATTTTTATTNINQAHLEF